MKQFSAPNVGRKPRDQEETRTQIAAVNLLRLSLPSDAVMHHTHNEGKRSITDASLAKAMGQRKGFADLIIFWQRGVYLIEFKSAKGSQSTAQKEFEADMKNTGFDFYAICRTVDECIAALKGWGVPVRVKGNSGLRKS
jgi:hypothetical protein